MAQPSDADLHPTEALLGVGLGILQPRATGSELLCYLGQLIGLCEMFGFTRPPD